jgi:MFS family permease
MAMTGLFFSFMGSMMIFVQGPILSYLSKKWPDPVFISSGSLILALSFLFYNSTNSWLMYGGALLLAIGNGIMWPSLLSLISKSISEKFQGTIQGYAGSLGSAASIIGLLSGGFLYTMIGSGIFVFSALVIFLIFLFSFLLFKDQDGTGQEIRV